MKPISLEMAAFGPYADKVRIDFTKLGEQGLYLIGGDTGAGKTTIFDALIYALYGEASGENRKTEMFRSKYAKPETKTYVCLIFDCQGKRYTVTRTPKYERAKVKGEGITKQNETAQLECEDGKILTKITEVTNAIVEIIGLDKQQFTQIAMIAQGDFLKVLFASTEERIKIFRQIFHTAKYEKIQKSINQDFKILYGECQDLQKSIAQYAKGITFYIENIFSENLHMALEKEMYDESMMEWLEKYIGSQQELEKSLDRELETLETDLTQGMKKITAGKEQEKKKEILSEKERELESLKKESGDVQNIWKEKQKDKSLVKVFIQEITTLNEKLSQYEQLDVVKKKLADLQETIMDNEKAEKDSQKQIENLCQKIEKAKQQSENYQSTETDLQRIENYLKDYKREKEGLNDFEWEYKEYQTLKKDYEAAKVEYQKEISLVEEVRTEYHIKERVFLDAQAGVLSSSLQDGCPCPVCGSLIHPKPAVKKKEIPDKKELELAKKSLEQKETDMRRTAADTAALKGRLQEKERFIQEKMEGLFGEKPNNNSGNVNWDFEIQILLEEKQKACADKIKSLETEKNKLEKMLQEKEELKKEMQEQELKLDKEKDKLVQIKELLAGAVSADKNLKEQITELCKNQEYPDKETLEQVIAEKIKKKEQLEMEIEQSDKQFHEMEKQKAALQGAITSLKSQILEQQIINVSEEEELQEKKTKQKQELAKKRADVHTVLEQNLFAKKNIQKKVSELKEKEKKYGWLKALNDTANGRQNENGKIMLETFVQMAYFERIIRQANKRFEVMSGGQYTLVRKRDITDNRSQTGLELEVLDHYNGSVRSVKTLSGGEAFLASLSLALGLADEIQANAGGIRLDTMFVDEGFGSLDEESLKQAIRVLTKLSEGNRLVGIISHVTELKNSIEKQILVQKDAGGCSSIKY